jgi:glycosyltransferase involved in cell wall biosynthesis
MSRVSILIPSRNELFLKKTVEDILEKATGDIEVIPVLDGYDRAEHPVLPDDKRIRTIVHDVSKGMRTSINEAASIATGKYLMKTDAHCLFGPGFDEILQRDCEDNEIIIPRRYSLDAENWKLNDKSPVDSMYYFYPFTPGHEHDPGLHGRTWSERREFLKDKTVYEDMTFQGSCWFMWKEHFVDRIKGMDNIGYETFMGEPQEIGFKTQLGPWHGRVMVNKNTYYAHLHKGKQYGRMYFLSSSERLRGNAYSFDFWWNNRWEERIHDIEWLIDKFWPLPNWPENWKEIKASKK